jgi:hypothetical protein
VLATQLTPSWLLLLAVATEPECERAANGAIVWHVSRVMYDIDLHHKQREDANRPPAHPFPKPSKIIDGFLSCMFFGVHLIYRERIHRVHPLSHVSLADFREYIQAIMLEWSGEQIP